MAGIQNRLHRLDAVRGLVAFYMLLHHYVHDNQELAFFQKFFVFGQASVMVFFILSGFVIYLASVAQQPEMTLRDYVVRRFRRIYPAFVLVLLIEIMLDRILPYQAEPFEWSTFLGNLLMLQDKQHPYLFFKPLLGNRPLWSLTYEWWFYIIFIPIWFLLKGRPEHRKYWASGITFFGFGSFMVLPNQFSLIACYFMMWWSGAELGREYFETGKLTWGRQAYSLVVLAISTGLWAILAYLDYRTTGKIMRYDYPYIQLQRHITILLILAVGITWYKLKFIGFDWTIGLFKPLSSISYVLYMIHLPLIMFADKLNLTGSVWLDMLWLFPIILGISWLIEVPFQRKINRWIR
jgi:peptidoglycan/LPS O-acetylase OafA/YrhL